MLQRYENLLADQRAEVAQCASQWTRVGIVRGALLLVCFLLLGLGIAQAYGLGNGWYLILAAVFVVFVMVALYHENLQQRMHRGNLLIKMHLESLARCRRQWDQIKVPALEIPKWFIPISNDLDLLGSSSIYKLIGIARTPLGTSKLKNWIIEGAFDAEVESRQQAVAELSPQQDWRLKFRLECEQLASSQSGPSQFIDWCESPNWFAQGHQWILWAARVTAVLSLIGLAGLLTGLIPLTIAGPALILIAVANFFMSVWRAGSIHEVFNRVSSRSNDAAHYVRLFDMVADYPAKCGKLQQLQQRLQRTGSGAQAKMQRLGLLVWLANIRRNGMMFVVYVVFEFLFFWDVHALNWLENWKAENGKRARDWFDDLAEVEALSALAKLAADNPAWVFPVVKSVDSADQVCVSGKQVGHPLLDESRVNNDVEVGPPGTVLLVTGSNMSGKSTLLRSLGANIVLAQMGSVVCADAMTLPPIRIETSMRIADSLADGVSFFMAELKRLKEIVDTAKAHSHDNPRRLLFLLDEILQGTNSRERQIAVSRVVRKLIDEQAIGAISTHDLDLAKTDELAQACRTVHFSEQFVVRDGKEVMTFDYRMKPGIAETTNALKLLELVGLGE